MAEKEVKVRRAGSGDFGDVYIFEVPAGLFVLKLGKPGHDLAREKRTLARVSGAWEPSSTIKVLPEPIKYCTSLGNLERRTNVRFLGIMEMRPSLRMLNPPSSRKRPVLVMPALLPLPEDLWSRLFPNSARPSITRLYLGRDSTKEELASPEGQVCGRTAAKMILGLDLERVASDFGRFLGFLVFNLKLDAADIALFVSGRSSAAAEGQVLEVTALDFSCVCPFLDIPTTARVWASAPVGAFPVHGEPLWPEFEQGLLSTGDPQVQELIGAYLKEVSLQ